MKQIFFGSKAQMSVGLNAFFVGLGAWLYWAFVTPPTVGAVFHVSMFFGLVACYAIVANAVGIKATERVEQIVGDDVDVDHADVVKEA